MSAVKAGICVHLKSGDNLASHLWIVLTDPQGEPPSIALVNLTKFRDGSDTTVVLDKGAHPFVKQRTVVNYARATIQSATGLERAMKADLTIRHQDDCSSELLETIRDGLFRSPFTKPKVQKFCEHLRKQQAVRASPKRDL